MNWAFLLFGAEEEPLELEKKLMVIQVRLAWLHIGSGEDVFGLGGHSRKSGRLQFGARPDFESREPSKNLRSLFYSGYMFGGLNARLFDLGGHETEVNFFSALHFFHFSLFSAFSFLFCFFC